MTEANNTPKIVGGLLVSAAIIAGILFLITSSGSDTVTQEQTQSTDVSQVEESATAVVAAEFLDGIYSASSSYTVPNGDVEPISVEIELANNQITSLSFDVEASNGTSEQWQGRFTPLVEDAVVGEDLNEADVSRLGGASLTSAAFNDLLDDVRAQALDS